MQASTIDRPEIPTGRTSACPQCDLLVAIPEVADAKIIQCPRCFYVITRFHKSSLQRGFSYAFSAFIFCVIANSYPFLTLSSILEERSISLFGSVLILVELGEPVLASLYFAMILLCPLLVLATLMLVLTAVQFRLNMPFLVSAYKTIYWIKEWAMAEVFLIGTFVSLVKITNIAAIDLEIGFWAYLIFAILLSMAVNSVDKLQVWQQIKNLTQ